MKRTVFTICFAALGLAVFGQDEGDYQKWMKTIGYIRKPA